MTFYQKSLCGELTLQTICELPLSEKMPQEVKEYFLHLTLINGSLIMMAADCVREQGLINGNSVSLCLNCSSEKEIKNLYEKLSAGGKANHPLEDTFWGALFGNHTISMEEQLALEL